MGLKGYFNKKSSAVKDTAKEVVGVDQIKEVFDEIYVKSYKHLKDGIDRNKNKEGENLTFSQAVEKYGLTPTILEKQYKAQAYSFYLLGLLFIGIFGLFTYYLFSGFFIALFTTFFVGGATLAIMFNNSVSCFRLKNQEFKTVQEWMNSGEYFPSLSVDFNGVLGKRQTKSNPNLVKK